MTAWQFIFGCVLTTLTLLLTGCTGATRTQIMVPVASPHVTPIQKPKLSIARTRKTDPSTDIIKSYVLSLNQAISYSRQQETIIKELSNEK